MGFPRLLREGDKSLTERTNCRLCFSSFCHVLKTAFPILLSWLGFSFVLWMGFPRLFVFAARRCKAVVGKTKIEQVVDGLLGTGDGLFGLRERSLGPLGKELLARPLPTTCTLNTGWSIPT